MSRAPEKLDPTIDSLVIEGRFSEAAELARSKSDAPISRASLQRICTELWPEPTDLRAEVFLLAVFENRPGKSAIESLERRRFLRGDLAGVEAAIRLGLARLTRDRDLLRDLAKILGTRQKLPEAEALFRELAESDPDDLEARAAIAFYEAARGELDPALATLREIEPRAPEIVTPTLVALLLYSGKVTEEELFDAHLRRGRQIEAGIVTLDVPARSQRPRRLRIGYLSADFRQHSVASFIEPVLRGHDRSRFEVHAYHSRAGADEITERIASLDLSFHDVSALDDRRLAERVRQDGIDVLVDLGGHTEHGRLGVLALRPAPVIISYLGYAATTGMRSVDARITDRIADPPGRSDDYHTEKLLRLEGSAWCFEPPHRSPDPGRDTGASVTFGSFNALLKVTPEVVHVWAKILQAVPGSRLRVKARAFASEQAITYYKGLFGKVGITSDRLDLSAWTPDTLTHLAAYREIDVALDPFPYNGTTTTCEASWMGVPVVTLLGTRHSGRVGASLLSALGLDDLVANSLDEYVAIAIALANSQERRDELRKTLRQRMLASPLTDAKSFARKLEASYDDIFAAYLDRRTPELDEDRIAQLTEMARRANDSGKLELAGFAAERVLSVEPTRIDLAMISARSHEAGGDVARAERVLTAAIAPDVDLGVTPAAGFELTSIVTTADLLRELARLRGRLGNREGQEQALTRSVALFPQSADGLVDLAIFFRDSGRMEDALGVLRDALRISPEDARATMLLGILEMSWGRHQDGILLLTRSFERSRADPIALSNLLYAHQYVNGSREEGFRRHLLYGVLHGKAREHLRRQATEESSPRLRVAYLSSDLREHSVARFMEGILRSHDRTKYEISLYASVPNPDHVTERLSALVDRIVFIDDMDADAAAERMARDGIDILVDLGGHTAKSRILVLSRCPAPILVSYLGYPDTTGVPAVHYRITDAIADPAGSDAFHSERLIRLADGAWCFDPRPGTPPVRERQAGQPFVFASFNVIAKVGDLVLETWAEILRRVSGSKLLLKSTFAADRVVAARVRSVFERVGVDVRRVELRYGSRDVSEHLDTYGEVDIALDPFPYCGTTTTCEALDMGVPVVSLAGDRHVSRVGASLLSRVGLTDLVASSREEYVEIAVRLAKNQERRQKLRRDLRETIRSSALGDTQRFTRSLERAFDAMWGPYVSSGQAPFAVDRSDVDESRKKRARELVEEAEAFLRTKRLEQAEVVARQAIATDPTSADAINLLGNALVAQRLDGEAEIVYRSALSADNGFYKAYNNLGNLLSKRGDKAGAVEMFQRAIELEPKAFKPFANLAHALRALGHTDSAMTNYRRSLALGPNAAAAQGLAELLQEKGDLEEGEVRGLVDILLDQGLCEAAALLVSKTRGVSLDQLSRLSEALDRADLGRADQLLSDLLEQRHSTAAFMLLEKRLWQRGNWSGLEALLRRAVALLPGVRVEQKLAQLLADRRRVPDAIDVLRNVLASDPSDSASRVLLARLETAYGFVDEGLAALLELPSRDIDADEAIALLMQYSASQTPEAIFAHHVALGERIERTFATRPGIHRPSGNRIRVGYVSADFREHSVARFIEPVLREHDRNKLQVFAYHTFTGRDRTTDRIAAMDLHFVDAASLDDDSLARRIRDDRIDLLVDLGGHTEHGRIAVFARRPAPTQITYLGYPDTTGLRAIHARLTDEKADPPGRADELTTEKLVRLPGSAWCFEPPTDAVDVSERSSREVTFGSFNSVMKLSATTIETWAEILRRIPSSTLVLKWWALRHDRARERCLGLFARHGVEPSRLDIRGWTEGAATHLHQYADIDIALDPFPYNGTTTTCEALWMGVPVVTLAGRRHAGRVGVSLLGSVGLSDLVASNRTAYVEIAGSLAENASRRAALRKDLRSRFGASALGNPRLFIKGLEQAYDDILAWRATDRESEP